ncbi:unnamed protein product, partial [Prorocentrum cordatum]
EGKEGGGGGGGADLAASCDRADAAPVPMRSAATRASGRRRGPAAVGHQDIIIIQLQRMEKRAQRTQEGEDGERQERNGRSPEAVGKGAAGGAAQAAGAVEGLPTGAGAWRTTTGPWRASGRPTSPNSPRRRHYPPRGGGRRPHGCMHLAHDDKALAGFLPSEISEFASLPTGAWSRA